MNGGRASSYSEPPQMWVLRDSKTLMKPALFRSRLTLHPVNQRAFHPIDISQLKQKTMRLIQALHHSNKEERIVYPLETTLMVRYDQVGSLEPCMSLKSAWRSLYWVMDLLRNLSSTLPTCSRKWDCKWNKESAQGNCRSLTKMICSTIISSIHTRVTCSDSIHEVADLTARKAAALGQVLNSVPAHRDLVRKGHPRWVVKIAASQRTLPSRRKSKMQLLRIISQWHRNNRSRSHLPSENRWMKTMRYRFLLLAKLVQRPRLEQLKEPNLVSIYLVIRQQRTSRSSGESLSTRPIHGLN